MEKKKGIVNSSTGCVKPSKILARELFEIDPKVDVHLFTTA